MKNDVNVNNQVGAAEKQPQADTALDRARAEIDLVDREMAALFVRRMRAVETVADYKREHGLPVLDSSREDAVVRKNASRIEDDELRPYYVEFLRDTMKASRHYQHKRLTGMRVAYSGIEGAYAAIAAMRLFPDAERVPYADFADAYRAAESGDCDVAILPIENSTAGEVGQVMDILFSGSLVVTNTYDLAITHNLVGIPGASVADIRRVISHPQALAQCARYIAEHRLEEQQAGNTALAARLVAEKGDKQLAAIASEETAALYGLEILDHNITETRVNTTRFAVLSRATDSTGSRGKHVMLTFTVRNEAGSLAKAINTIGDYGYNMRCLRSRPMKELLWQYYFYVELEGDLETENGRKMMESLAGCCEKLKVLGSFCPSAGQ